MIVNEQISSLCESNEKFNSKTDEHTDDANDVNGNSMFYDFIVSVYGVRRIKLYSIKLNISKWKTLYLQIIKVWVEQLLQQVRVLSYYSVAHTHTVWRVFFELML